MSENQHITIVIVYFVTEVNFHFYQDFPISELFTFFLFLINNIIFFCKM